MERKSICGIPGYWHLDIKKEASTFLLILLVYFVTNLFFGDLLGLSQVSKWTSRTLFFQWIAPYYPNNENPGVSNDISVVLLTEADLRKQQASWPVSYEFHADVLDSILERNPKSILIDIGFIDKFRPKNSLGDLVDVLRRAKEKKGVEIFLAAPQASLESKASVLPELLKYGEPVSVLVDSTRMGNRYILQDENGRDSAALAIYNSAHPDPDKIEPICSGEKAIFPPMHIAWGEFRESKNNGPYQCNGCILHLSPPDRILKTILSNFPPTAENFFEEGFNNVIRQTCPPHRTITIDYLLHGNDSWLNENIKNHFIFYGVDLDMVDDSIMPPTHKKLPGIYVHAMALDNLLQFKNNYITDDRPLCDAKICEIIYSVFSISSIATFFLWVFISLLTALEIWLINGACINRKGRIMENPPQICFSYKLVLWALLIDVILALIAAMAIFFVVWCLYTEHKIAPIDFIGISSLITLGIGTRFIKQARLSMKG
jgi:CHASE2 domain-containing sensor protein